eukprot:CAMPEP_0113716160 /NCGR_PEP_ID=MMETSP0038_2-20120614/33731_1 /TAXON_ID=2898 /ORGANISM="Cryptomonas paramecium" /LENGTH=49 /DNA_ID=CAMNT_0000643643 /DNA_START=63 /DNA_END=208 /DNA_ORIENTATION=+ /assembly_acc=CAM_ASM_000170
MQRTTATPRPPLADEAALDLDLDLDSVFGSMTDFDPLPEGMRAPLRSLR